VGGLLAHPLLYIQLMQRLHPLHTFIEKPKRFTYPFCYEPHPLCVMAAEEVQRYIKSMDGWKEEIGRGKMFGVLVVENEERLGYLAAYSGLLCGRNDWPFFVPAIFDLTQSDGHFKKGEEYISSINRQIEALENSKEYYELKGGLQAAKIEANKGIAEYKDEVKRKKRDMVGEGRIRTSQFLNAELRRKKKCYAEKIDEIKQRLQVFEGEIDALKLQRKRMSNELQCWLFTQFRMLNARGEWRDLCDIFADTAGGVPPSGAGECCAPKLLQYAYTQKLHPLCMAEFWWGASPKNEVRHHLHYYPACRGKCKPILEHMMQGLDVDPDPRAADERLELKIVYDDEHICVVGKPAGMLSVPGKSARRSVLSEMRQRYPNAEEPMIVHRLDMDTSGLMVIAKTRSAYLNLQRQFCEHTIRKKYIAQLVRKPDRPFKGTINLPLRSDPLDRPRQVVDLEHGKESLTDYLIKTTSDGTVIAELYPRTGRTHQLRLHCAHDDGLGVPIVGDTLYGKPADRLHLHAERIDFLHPITGTPMTFEIKAEFHDNRSSI